MVRVFEEIVARCSRAAAPGTSVLQMLGCILDHDSRRAGAAPAYEIFLWVGVAAHGCGRTELTQEIADFLRWCQRRESVPVLRAREMRLRHLLAPPNSLAARHIAELAYDAYMDAGEPAPEVVLQGREGAVHLPAGPTGTALRQPGDLEVGTRDICKFLSDVRCGVSTKRLVAALKAGEIRGAQRQTTGRRRWVAARAALVEWARTHARGTEPGA